MQLKENSTSQKLRGAYYTPLQLADAMVGLFSYADISTVLEPSCGDGIFIDRLLNIDTQIQSITVIEVEPDEAEKVANRYRDNDSISVITGDFFEFYDNNLEQEYFDLILGNPPYIRYQYLTEKQREILSQILVSHGMKANKLINAWVGFLVACTQMLSSNGKIAFVVPAEILQVAYAEDLREFLSNRFSMITLIAFEKLVFPDIEQEILIFIGEKGGEERGIRIIEMDDLNDFKSFDLNSNGYQKLQYVREKWTKYFISEDEASLIQRLRKDNRFSQFKDFGIINVGITTGNNDYFSVDSIVEANFALQDVTLPLIGRSSHAHGIFFSFEDWRENVEHGKRAMLVKFPDIPFDEYPPHHKEYIALGERDKQNTGYKCRIRDRWYIVPSVWAPDAFFLRRNNLYPKFVLNQCNAVSTDTMHRMKFNDDVDAKNVLLSYYNSISFAFTEICGRSYGGGVLEILPGEMGNILIPKIESIDISLRDNLLCQIDMIVRNNENIELALDLVDNKLLVDVLGIAREICLQCRTIWKKMQSRRLRRSSTKP